MESSSENILGLTTADNPKNPNNFSAIKFIVDCLDDCLRRKKNVSRFRNTEVIQSKNT